ncbi:MAG: hypothetical protein HYS13_21050 [Planctomycetia bacterium]|nr:hypothetical protein [Planctomycetia bacterium]
MKKHLTPAKIAAAVCSLLLLCGYVYVRAGGTIWPGAAKPATSPQAQTAPAPELFPGSKSAPVEFAVPSEGQEATPPGGSSAEQPPARPATSAQTDRRVIMAGSKSAAVFTPPAESSSAAAPQQQGAQRQPAAPQAARQQPASKP